MGCAQSLDEFAEHSTSTCTAERGSGRQHSPRQLPEVVKPSVGSQRLYMTPTETESARMAAANVRKFTQEHDKKDARVLRLANAKLATEDTDAATYCPVTVFDLIASEGNDIQSDADDRLSDAHIDFESPLWTRRGSLETDGTPATVAAALDDSALPGTVAPSLCSSSGCLAASPILKMPSREKPARFLGDHRRTNPIESLRSKLASHA